MISAISKQVFKIFDCAEYFPIQNFTLLLGLGWTIKTAVLSLKYLINLTLVVSLGDV